MKVFTIGFTKISAARFFELLRKSGAERVVDIRLNNVSQLAGFTKKNDLPFFLREICGMDYVHIPSLAPSKEVFDGLKKHHRDWDRYEREFLALMQKRRIEDITPRETLDNACLLCTEDSPAHCHRRLVLEYLQSHWGTFEVVHLVR